MKSTMGIILTDEKNSNMRELTSTRSSSAIPVGAKFRAIDFTLSNMVNSGIRNVGIITQYNYHSLMDHLGSGKEWDLDRKQDGLYIFPPSLSGEDSTWYRGSADAMFNNITFLKRSNEEYVVVAKGNCVCNMNFDDMLKYHEDNAADITICYINLADIPKEELSLFGLISVDKTGRITDYKHQPVNPDSMLGSTGIFIIKRTLLISLLEECAAHGDYDFVKDVVIKKINDLKIFGYEFKGYFRMLVSIRAYYRCNKELLLPEIQKELFISHGKIYTKVKDETPAKYNDEAEVRNSIIADGCIIEGTVINCVLFRGVTVKKGAYIKDSIIMQGSSIDEHVHIEYAILDKNVELTPGKYLKGEANWPIIIDKNVKV